MQTHLTPGVYRADAPQAPAAVLRSGVPAFLGLAAQGSLDLPERLLLWNDFAARFGAPPPGGFLAAAVHGFFANGGTTCHVIRLDDAADPLLALERGLEAIAALDEVDLVCLPDASRLRPPGQLSAPPDLQLRVQRRAIDDCELRGGRVAILDSLPDVGRAAVLDQRRALSSASAALYYPWILVQVEGTPDPVYVPPCGHVAGIYASTDRETGVHKAPANAVVVGALDLEQPISDDVQAALNPWGVNCLRAFPGRGIRVWGARTLAADPEWTYVNVRRVFLTAARWIALNLADVPFEPNDQALWGRVLRELEAYFTELYRQGALKGASLEEAFYVRCDASTNTGSEPGHLVAEVGLAAAVPGEFIVVHFVQEAAGVVVASPNRSN